MFSSRVGRTQASRFLINVYLRYIQKKNLNRPHFVLLAARNAFSKTKINDWTVSLHCLVSDMNLKENF